MEPEKKDRREISTGALMLVIVFIVALGFLLLFLAFQLGYVDIGSDHKGPECLDYGEFISKHEAIFKEDWALAGRWDANKKRELSEVTLPSLWGASSTWTQAHIESFLKNTPVRTKAFEGGQCGSTTFDESHLPHGEPAICTASDGESNGFYPKAYKDAVIHLMQHDARYADIHKRNPSGALDKYAETYDNEMSNLAKAAVADIQANYVEVSPCVNTYFFWYVFFGLIGVIMFAVALARWRSIGRLLKRSALLMTRVALRLSGRTSGKKRLRTPTTDETVTYVDNPMLK